MENTESIRGENELSTAGICLDELPRGQERDRGAYTQPSLTDVQGDQNLAVLPKSGPFLAWGFYSGQITGTVIPVEPGNLDPVDVLNYPRDDRSKTTDRSLLAFDPFPLGVKSAHLSFHLQGPWQNWRKIERPHIVSMALVDMPK
jgi:hypothetical protein